MLLGTSVPPNSLTKGSQWACAIPTVPQCKYNTEFLFTDFHRLQGWQQYQVLMYLIYMAHLVVPSLYRITSMYDMNSGTCIAYMVRGSGIIVRSHYLYVQYS